MRIGGQMFFTDYSMSPTELARALEERGFDSLWVPEHSHIPLTRKSPFPSGGDLSKKYYDVMDPFVVLSAAAAVTKTLLHGTGICLIAQRDPIQTAKQVASIDQVSGGRFLFGVGNGWNEDEMANHGTAFASQLVAARESGAVVGHLVLIPAVADAEQETAARDLVDRRDLLGGLDRVAQSDQANAGPEQQRLGHRRGRTEHHERVHHVVILLRKIAAAGEGRFARQWNM